MRLALNPAGHRVPRTKPTCLLHTWRPHRRQPFALVLHLHQHQCRGQPWGSPLTNGEIPLKTSKKPRVSASCLSVHTEHGPRRGGPGGPPRRPTQRSPRAGPGSRAHTSLEWAPPRSRVYAYLERAPPRSRVHAAPEQAPPRSRAPRTHTSVPARGYGHLML
jgi:hypothetical protein